MKEENKRKCDICQKEYNSDKVDVNVRHTEGKTIWICEYCQHEEFKAQYELVKEVHNSFDSALEVDNYPYGFRLRTKIRYWIETTKQGDRFCSCTLNPKTNRWNNPKKSTYSDVGLIIKDKSNGYISWYPWGVAYSRNSSLENFIVFAGDYPFNELQQKKIREGKAIYKTREYISFEIVETTSETDEEKKIREEEQAKIKSDIQKIHYIHLKQEGAL